MQYGIKQFKLKKDIMILLIAVLIMHLAAYLIIPILPIILRSEKGLTAGHVGAVIGANSIAFQFGSILSGLMSDRIGKKTTMFIGSTIQAFALFSYAFTSEYSLLILISVANGVGSGIFAPTVKAAIAALTSDSADTRTTAFSLRGIAANIGTSIAGITLFFLATIQSNYLFFISSIIYFLLAILTIIFLPKDCRGKQCPRIPLNSYKLIFQNKPFLYFAFIIILVNAIFSQLQFLLPLRAESVLTNGKIVGSIWTIISIEVILIQTFISNQFLKKYKELTAIFWSLLFFASGILLIGNSNTFILLTLSAIVFTVGQMFLLPTEDSLVSKLAHTELIGAYFSITNLLTGLGIAIGTFTSGKLIEHYGINSINLWIIISITTLVIALLVFTFNKLRLIEKKNEFK